MWLFTPIGFFSIVKKPQTTCLTIRARVRGDLDALRDRYLPELSPTIGHGGTDYPWRATATREAVAEATRLMVMDIDYPNFKSEVGAKQGHARASHYGAVWNVLYDMAEKGPK